MKVGVLSELLEGEWESWGDDTALVESSVKVNDDLSGSSIIDDLEVVDVSSLLHLHQELDDDLGRRADQHLSPSALLGVGDCFKAICEY